MTATVLGISAFYHDSAAAIVSDGEIVAAAQEERFTRKKHDPRFPRHAINYCLGEAFVEPTTLDAVVFYDNPLLTFDRVVESMPGRGAARARSSGSRRCRSILGTKVARRARTSARARRRACRVLFTRAPRGARRHARSIPRRSRARRS